MNSLTAATLPYTSGTTICKLDPSARHFAIMELKRPSTTPFQGEPHLFKTWMRTLQHRMKGLDLSPMDTIDILEAHSSGEAQQVIQLCRATTGADPDKALQAIWKKLTTRFGSSVGISSSLRQRLLVFPAIMQDDKSMSRKLREFSDLCHVVEANMPSAPDLQALNFAEGLQPIRSKLPISVANKWRTRGTSYERNHGEHPPFHTFCSFLEEQAEEYCNPNYGLDTAASITHNPSHQLSSRPHRTFRTSIQPKDTALFCAFHKSKTHSIHECSVFTSLHIDVRRTITRSLGICYRCLGNHLAKNCYQTVQCDLCSSTDHITLLHKDKSAEPASTVHEVIEAPASLPGSADITPSSPHGVSALCSKVCQLPVGGRSCGKTLLVDVSLLSDPQKKLRTYAIIDEQSDQSFASPQLFEYLDISSPIHSYTLSTLAKHKTSVHGRIAHNLVIQGITEPHVYPLPPLFENSLIPDTKDEVATPAMVQAHDHIAHLAANFPQLAPGAQVTLLIGRDGGNLLMTEAFGTHAPFVHHTTLGWAVVGSICPLAIPAASLSHTAHTLYSTVADHDHFATSFSFDDDVFKRRPDDEFSALSADDKKFLQFVQPNISTTPNGNLQLPLPFKEMEPSMPDNQAAIYRRQKTTLSRLVQDPNQLTPCLESMSKNITMGHVETVPLNEISSKTGTTWFLPVFPVKHPKKGKVRLVFDSAASFQGTSLNSHLLQGPDSNNRLRSVLTRFREGEIGFIADIESMFHSFFVDTPAKDFMRFFWFKDNNPTQPLVQYRANVHIFGNKSSPAIATLALRHAASHETTTAEEQRARTFVRENFYVDDGLGCANTAEDCIDILRTSRKLLGRFNIHLHKIVASDQKVLQAFPKSERADSLRQVNFEDAPLQRTLGLAWDIQSDCFTLKVDTPERPFTRRGVLAVINSIYDPLGMASPVTLEGKLLQRQFLTPTPPINNTKQQNWDEPLPDHLLDKWVTWQSSLPCLDSMKIPRSYCPKGFGKPTQQKLHVFSDASNDAIGHVMYLQSFNDKGECSVAFLSADSKIAPRCATSIPRLELCAAVEASKKAKLTATELVRTPDSITFYTDSKVVLGYIQNKEKRFTRYVERRIEMIHNNCGRSEWRYVPTELNPADLATRSATPEKLSTTKWLCGPTFLHHPGNVIPTATSEHDPNIDLPETRPDAPTCRVMKAKQQDDGAFANLANRAGSWRKLLRVAMLVATFIISLVDKARQKCGSQSAPRDTGSKATSANASKWLILEAQRAAWGNLPAQLNHNKEFPSTHPLANLMPFLDSSGILRVGGRLRQSGLSFHHRHPILLPNDHPVSQLLLAHYHKECDHQGRHITRGFLREAGYHIHRGTKMLTAFIRKCIICRRLRAPLETQRMADLPSDRLSTIAPFTHCGMDVFGPWMVKDGLTTRGRRSESKSWAIIFTCQASRAVHVEQLCSMDTPTFKNALRRFFSIRGACSLLRSDNGTNFIGAKSQDENIDFAAIKDEIEAKGCSWELNPPKASHHGGSWERKIKQMRAALDASLLLLGTRQLTRDELHTFLCEAAAIVNATPLWDVSADPNDPMPLSPAHILTLKEQPHQAPIEEFEHADLLAYGKKRWRRVQYLADQFWQQWKTTYLQQLQARQKWLSTKRNLSVGDVVLLRDKSQRRNAWPLGRVTKTKVSDDGLVRSIHVQIAKTTGRATTKFVYERPVSEVVLLLAKADDS